MELEGAEPSEQKESKKECKETISADDYKELIVQMRITNVLFQQVSSVPIGELTMLLMISRLSEEMGEVKVSSLGKVMRLSKPAVSRMLHTLKKKGYVQMKNSDKDQRYVFVYFTEQGRTLLKKEMEYANKLMQKVRERMGDQCMKEYLQNSDKFHRILSEEVISLSNIRKEGK